MSNDKVEELIKTTIKNSENEHKIAPQLTDELWTRLEARDAKTTIRKFPVVWVRVAAVLVILIGISFVFMQRGRDSHVVYKQQPTISTPVSTTPPDSNNISHTDIAAAEQSELGKSKTGYANKKIKTANKYSRAQIAAQLAHMEDPLRLEIAGIAVKDGKQDIKDRIEF